MTRASKQSDDSRALVLQQRIPSPPVVDDALFAQASQLGREGRAIDTQIGSEFGLAIGNLEALSASSFLHLREIGQNLAADGLWRGDHSASVHL